MEVIKETSEIGVWKGGKPAGQLIRQSHGTGWEVQIGLRIKGSRKCAQQYFSDKKYGGTNAAYEAAKKWHQEKSDELGFTRNKYRYITDDIIEVKLGHGKTMVTNARFLPIVEAETWSLIVKGYCGTGSTPEKKGKRFHNVISGFKFVDHINRDRLDNRIENIRQSSLSENAKNINMHKTNISGVNGVYLSNDEGRPTWYAQWRENGKQRKRSFAVGKYGDEGAKKLAIEAREAADRRTGTTNGKEVAQKRPRLE